MRTIHTVTNESEEKEKYYEEDESLIDAQERYYGEAESLSEVDRMTSAIWAGTLAKEEQLEGHINREDFKSLFKGTLPGSEQRIRGERPNVKDKERLAHDVVLSAPKSVSQALHLEGDLRLFDAHMESVLDTLTVIEQKFANTRIQVDGVRQVVNTGNLIAALMPHHTSRDGDMQLHTHMLIMNGTKGPDGVWRSLCHEALAQAQWVGSYYRQRLAEKVQTLGYRIYNTEHGFELQGYSREDIEVFSKRNRAIVEAVKKDGLAVNAQNKKQKVLTTRQAKSQTGQKLEEIQSGWREEGKKGHVGKPERSRPLDIKPEFKTALDEVNSAIRHLSERSVHFNRDDIYTYAFEHVHAEGLSLKQVDQAINEHESLLSVGNGRFTTVEALEQEIEIRQSWMAGQGKAIPLLSNPKLEQSGLKSGQESAVRRTLTSTDTHQIIHGLAGVGKTTALGELIRQLQGTGVEVRGFSPTIDAAGVLQEEIYIKTNLHIKTNTVEHLVLSKPELTKNQLWMIDEAGMVSSRQMQEIERKASSVGARILLVGDKGQNSSVEAGSPLRSLIAHGATTHSIREIVRQEDSIQKQAVELIAAGNGSEALELLKENGYVKEEGDRKERTQAIAHQYLALSKKERSETLIVTGTNTERLSITKAIRKGLKAEGELGAEIRVVQLVSRQLTAEESRRIQNYRVGDYIRMHRDYESSSLKKGQLYKVEKFTEKELIVSSYGGRLHHFDPAKYKEKEVLNAAEIEIAVGDRLRWTTSDKSQGQINGQSFTVTGIEGTTMSGVNQRGKTMNVSLLQPLSVDYGLVSTSYRAQSKTQKRVIVSATSDPTSSREPFYVKISRQTKELSVYTQDLAGLRDWVQRSNAQENPLELLEKKHEQRNISDTNTFGHPRAAEPDGTEAQRYGLQVQPNAIDDNGSIERLCGQIDNIAITEAIGGLRAVVEGLNRINQNLQQGNASRDRLTREVGRLNEQLSNTDRAADRGAEERLLAAIQQRQISESIQQPLLGLKNALDQVKSIKPVDTEPLVELVDTLQQQVLQLHQDAARTIQDEKLNVLAEAISQWRATKIATEALELQQIAADISTIGIEQAASEVLRTQEVAQSIHQVRAEDYIHTALQNFNQVLAQGLNSVRTNSQQLDVLLDKLQGLIGKQRQETISLVVRKVEAFWEPGPTQSAPPSIDPKHWQEWVEDSCVHPAIAGSRLQTIYGNAVYNRLLSEKLATLGSGQYVTQPMARLMQAYQQLAESGGWWVNSGVDPRSFPSLTPGETPQLSVYGTFKPNEPRQDELGKIRKYENPQGTKKELFDRDLNFGTVPDEIAEKIYKKYGVTPTAEEKGSGFWYVVFKHPEIPIYRTEGNKKDAAITSQGRVVISGQGVNAGYRAKDQFGNKLPQRVLHPQLEVFAQPGREFRFSFDQDSKLSTILNVRQELVREAELLKERGCNIYSLQWDHHEGKGADDLIKNRGPLAFEQADRQAVSIEQVMKQHYRTKYNSTAKQVNAELGNVSPERLDLEIYVRAIEKGDNSDGARFVGESDTVRSLCGANPENAKYYLKAIAAVAGTYKRLANREVEELDKLVAKAVQQQAATLKLEHENFRTLGIAYEKSSRSGPKL